MCGYKASLRVSHRAQGGFSAVDALVGLIMGLLVSLAAVGTLSVFTTVQRANGGVATVVSSGSNALSSLATDLGHAGHGFYYDGERVCDHFYVTDGAGVVSSANNAVMRPVWIEHDASNERDTITILGSSSSIAGAFVRLLTPMTGQIAETASYYDAMSSHQILIASVGNPCLIRPVDSVTAMGVGVSIKFGDSASAVSGLALTYPARSLLSNLIRLNWRRYSINTTDWRLQVNDLLTSWADPVTISENVVQMRAQYGLSTAAGTASVEQWVDATGAWASPTAEDMGRVRAIRVALVVRGEAREKGDATGTSCRSTETLPTLWDGVNAKPPGADWKCYRYRVLATVIPLRNVNLGVRT